MNEIFFPYEPPKEIAKGSNSHVSNVGRASHELFGDKTPADMERTGEIIHMAGVLDAQTVVRAVLNRLVERWTARIINS